MARPADRYLHVTLAVLFSCLVQDAARTHNVQLNRNGNSYGQFIKVQAFIFLFDISIRAQDARERRMEIEEAQARPPNKYVKQMDRELVAFLSISKTKVRKEEIEKNTS